MYDARLEREDWWGVGGSGLPVGLHPAPAGKLAPQILPPIRVVGELIPRSVVLVHEGVHLIDYGQNPTGVVRLSVRGARGTTVTLRHSEVLGADGLVDQRILRILDLADVYILKGSERETHEPRFTYHRFRYVQVEGYPGELRPEDAIALVIRSDVPPTGTFECSTSSTTGSTRRCGGSCPATCTVSPPTARSATSAGAGWQTPTSRRTPTSTTSTCSGSTGDGWTT